MRKSNLPQNLISAMDKKSDQDFLKKIELKKAISLLNEENKSHAYLDENPQGYYLSELVDIIRILVDKSIRKISNYHMDSVITTDSKNKKRKFLKDCGFGEDEVNKMMKNGSSEAYRAAYSRYLKDKWESVNLDGDSEFNKLYAFLYANGKIPLGSKDKLLQELLYCKDFSEYSIAYSVNYLE